LPTNTRARDRTHNLMVDRFWNRFGGWKLHLLSHTGRAQGRIQGRRQPAPGQPLGSLKNKCRMVKNKISFDPNNLFIWIGHPLSIVSGSAPGRATLIKSVLTSLPVYHMSIAPLPVKTTSQLTSLMRKFFCTKLEQNRYLAIISWYAICQPQQDGGFHIWDLRIMNDALILKLAWQMAQNQNRLWIGIMHAKYCPNDGF
jgi:hypothetical protein